MSLLVVATSIMCMGIAVYLYGVYRGIKDWDHWALSMVIRNVGFTTIVVSLTLFIVWWVQP